MVWVAPLGYGKCLPTGLLCNSALLCFWFGWTLEGIAVLEGVRASYRRETL